MLSYRRELLAKDYANRRHKTEVSDLDPKIYGLVERISRHEGRMPSPPSLSA